MGQSYVTRQPACLKIETKPKKGESNISHIVSAKNNLTNPSNEGWFHFCNASYALLLLNVMNHWLWPQSSSSRLIRVFDQADSSNIFIHEEETNFHFHNRTPGICFCSYSDICDPLIHPVQNVMKAACPVQLKDTETPLKPWPGGTEVSGLQQWDLYTDSDTLTSVSTQIPRWLCFHCCLSVCLQD